MSNKIMIIKVAWLLPRHGHLCRWRHQRRRNFRKNGGPDPTFWSGRTDPHFISTPSHKFCLVPHFSDQSYATGHKCQTCDIYLHTHAIKSSLTTVIGWLNFTHSCNYIYIKAKKRNIPWTFNLIYTFNFHTTHHSIIRRKVQKQLLLDIQTSKTFM